MTGWETFTFEGKTAIPKLTIRKGGQIGLNSMAVKKFKLDKFKFIILQINKEETKIGIKPTNNENEEGARKFKIIQGGATIHAKNFIEYYELNKIKERRMICDWDEENKMIFVKYSK